MFGIGPAGTGKTYLAMAQAVSYLLAKKVSRIILARPAVEAGEKLGFLPGDLQEKVNPYLRPLYDALYDMIDVEKAERLLERGTIEVAPIAFMRGRTLNDAFVILDEAQNTTVRADEDVPDAARASARRRWSPATSRRSTCRPAAMSGLVEAMKVVGDIEGIAFVYFDERDVVRHKLVQQIVKAYDAYGTTDARDEARLQRLAPSRACTSRSSRRLSARRRAGRWLAGVAPRARARRGHHGAGLRRRMRALNRQFRGKDAATDVLSFPGRTRAAASTSGDVAASPPGVATRQAQAAGHAVSTELRVLALHGLLHLLGYDHEHDDGAMARAGSAAAPQGRAARRA